MFDHAIFMKLNETVTKLHSQSMSLIESILLVDNNLCDIQNSYTTKNCTENAFFAREKQWGSYIGLNCEVLWW